MGNFIVDRPQFVAWVSQLQTRKVPDDILRLAKGRKRIILVRVHEVGTDPSISITFGPARSTFRSGKSAWDTSRCFEPLSGDRF
jgi:hypothetical protein